MSTNAPKPLLIGQTLRELRAERGHSQEWVAFEADITRTYLSQLENDLKSPTIDMLARICAVLGVRLSELFAAAEAAQDSEE